jgi:hypothetical protein
LISSFPENIRVCFEAVGDPAVLSRVGVGRVERDQWRLPRCVLGEEEGEGGLDKLRCIVVHVLDDDADQFGSRLLREALVVHGYVQDVLGSSLSVRGRQMSENHGQKSVF